MLSITGDSKISTDQPQRSHPLLTWLKRYRWFTLAVIVPTILATIYYSLIASDQYVSQSRFAIKSPSQKPGQMSTLASLIQTTGLSSGQEQTNEVLDYLRSRNALTDLSKRTDIRKKFMLPDIDLLSRYPGIFTEDRFENLYKYYTGKVEAHLDNDTSLAVLEVRAFTPQDAQEINEKLLTMSEALINRLNDRARQKAIAEGEKRVAEAQTRVRRARGELAAFRNSNELIDPTKQAGGVLQISDKMIAEQAAMRAELDIMERVAPRHPSIPSLRARVAAAERQIEVQNGRAVGGGGGIASKLSGYENLSLEQEFSTQMLAAANATLEQSRTEAEKQQYYLERVVEPQAPDIALYPSRLKQILTIAVASLCLYFIAWMLIVGILEHSPED